MKLITAKIMKCYRGDVKRGKFLSLMVGYKVLPIQSSELFIEQQRNLFGVYYLSLS